MRRSLMRRLLLLAGAVAIISITATTWLVMSSTTAAIRQQQGQSLSKDAHIYRQLIAYAAQHRSWSAAKPRLRALADRTGRTITLTTLAHRRLLSTQTDGVLPTTPTAVVDALAVEPALDPGADSAGIAAQVLGPYRRSAPPRASASVTPNGVSAVAADRRALTRLAYLVNRCLPRRHPIAWWRLAMRTGLPKARVGPGNSVLARCYVQARKRQLRPHVAPAALLYVSGGGTAATALDLSGSHRRQILAVALLILLVTISVTALAARQLTRPLRALTAAVDDIASGAIESRVEITGNDEVARLGRAFNEMAARRNALEAQRTVMVNDIAHELRTPVSNIRGWLEAAQDGLAKADGEFVASLLEEADQLTHLIEDLTDLAAADAGALRIYVEPVDLRDIATQVAAAHRIAAELAGVRVVSSVDAQLDGDPVRLRQLLGNLVSNAVRHSPRGATVTIRSRLERDTVAIDVADTGTGISAADLDHVFDRFWRSEKSRARSTGGSGLGLAIVRRLAEAHGGSVIVESAVGTGSTFTVRLPIEQRKPR